MEERDLVEGVRRGGWAGEERSWGTYSSSGMREMGIFSSAWVVPRTERRAALVNRFAIVD